jgi:hypothetical protein
MVVMVGKATLFSSLQGGEMMRPKGGILETLQNANKVQALGRKNKFFLISAALLA